jgi:PAS domain S-box-containing protein
MTEEGSFEGKDGDAGTTERIRELVSLLQRTEEELEALTGGQMDLSAASRRTPAGDQQFTEQLTRLIWATNRLASAPSVDELCRQAVLTGLEDLGFDRMSIWLVDDDKELMRGTYGTDERGNLRDERSHSHRWDGVLSEVQLMRMPHALLKLSRTPLFNDAHEVVGYGEMAAAALWNGEAAVGLLNVDNLISQKPFGEHQWRILELYASMLGHLLSLKRTESALRSNEELLNQILNILPVGIFVLSPEEKITRFNRAAQEIWEFDSDTIEHWSPMAWWTQDGRVVGKEEWAGHRALRNGESVLNQEVEILNDTHTRRVLLNSGVPLRNAAGELTGAVVVNQEITVRKRREEQLAALVRMGQALRPLVARRSVSCAVVEQLIELLPTSGVAVVLEGKGGHLLFDVASGNLAPLVDEVLPDGLLPLGRDDRAPALRILDTQQETLPSIFKKIVDLPSYLVIAPLMLPGSTVGALVVGFAERPSNDLLQLVGTLADHSAGAIHRGQLYEEVTTQARQLDRVMESVNFGLVLLDPRQRVVLANQHAQAELVQLAKIVVGEELRELGGQKLSRFLTPRTGQAGTQEITSGGRLFEITTVPVGETGAEGGWLMMIHDVTHERAAQASMQQHQRLAAVGQLAAGIAHDFNNIIAVILLYVHMLQHNPALDEDDQKRLSVIHEQAQDATRLIRQILDFSRQRVIERHPVDLKQLITETVALWERTLPETISYHVVMEAKGLSTVFAEANSLQQVLTNLAVNARDAMPHGGELTISLRSVVVRADEAPVVTGLKVGEWLEVCVTDSGEGIQPEYLHHIFDPFFTTKDIGKGTGLGLAQVYGIIQQHGGLVTAHSEVGKGTSICFFLPVGAGSQPATSESDANEYLDEGSETILLVEDNGPAREATTALLEMMGYRVLAAADGRVGLDLFHQYRNTIQLVISDLVMPEMGGMELYQRVRAENPKVSLMIMTGYPLENEGRALLEQGIVEWLQKPFTVKQLTTAVRRVLDQGKNAGPDDEE